MGVEEKMLLPRSSFYIWAQTTGRFCSFFLIPSSKISKNVSCAHRLCHHLTCMPWAWPYAAKHQVWQATYSSSIVCTVRLIDCDDLASEENNFVVQRGVKVLVCKELALSLNSHYCGATLIAPQAGSCEELVPSTAPSNAILNTRN